MSSGGSSRELLTFPLAPLVRNKLTSAGFLTEADLGDIRPSQLSKGELHCIMLIKLKSHFSCVLHTLSTFYYFQEE